MYMTDTSIMATPEPPEENPVKNIASDGDLTFVVGSPAQRFSVCAAVLRNRSEVFAAMHSDRFLEGQNLAAGIKEIPLPEDDPDTMQILLHCIHGQYYKVDEVPLPCVIAKAALLADKYDCVEAMWFVFRSWIAPHLEEPGPDSAIAGLEETALLAVAAYLLRMEDNFRLFTKRLVRDYTTPLAHVMRIDDIKITDVLTPKLLCESTICPTKPVEANGIVLMEKQRIEAYETLSAGIERFNTFQCWHCAGGCRWTKLMKKHWEERLARARETSPRHRHPDWMRPLRRGLQRLLVAAEMGFSNTEEDVMPCGPTYHCWDSPTPVNVKSLQEKATRAVRGLCLDCARNDSDIADLCMGPAWSGMCMKVMDTSSASGE